MTHTSSHLREFNGTGRRRRNRGRGGFRDSEGWGGGKEIAYLFGNLCCLGVAAGVSQQPSPASLANSH